MLLRRLLNRRFTFGSDVRHGSALPKFLAISAVGAVFNAGIVSWLLPRWQVHYLVIQLLATGNSNINDDRTYFLRII